MASLPSFFSDFLTGIRPTKPQRDDYKEGHKRLTERLNAEESLKPLLVSDFLQGSYRRSTAVRPRGDSRPDVDVIAVTRLDSSQVSAEDALDRFIPFLDKHYKDKWKKQGRSFGIELSKVELDLVVTSAPDEAEEELLTSEEITLSKSVEELSDGDRVDLAAMKSAEQRDPKLAQIRAALKRAGWQLSPLEIPDRDANTWQDTHPLAQIDWTVNKNAETNGHYVNVVKALKWWRKVNYETPKYPKGYPLEHLIGQACPDGIESVAEGVVRTLETIRDDYQAYAALRQCACLKDHGVEQDVFHRTTGEDFAQFHSQVKEGADIARRAYDEINQRESANGWINLFGDKFPKPPDGGSNKSGGGPDDGGYTEREEPSRIRGGRFA